jgi:hypothetical protein
MGIMDLNVEKRPIVIVANFRTKSTALGSYIQNKYNITRFSEPINSHRSALTFSEFMDDGSNTNFVLKFIADQMDDCKYYREILAGDCYKIRLLRRNVPEQIASYYIASKTQTFFQKVNEDEIPSCYIKIVRSHLLRAMNTILNNNALLEESNIQFDETIYSEDLPFLEDTIYVESTKPTNYQAIYDAACRLYETRDTYRLRLLL